MPSTDDPGDDFPMLSEDFVNFNGMPQNLDDFDFAADDFLNFAQSNDSQPKGQGLLQPTTDSTLPSNLSPTASDQDSASDSSRSTNAMNNGDGDVDMALFEKSSREGFGDFDFNSMSSMYEQNTINPAMIDQPMGGSYTSFGRNAASPPRFDSSSPSDFNSSPGTLNDHEDEVPADRKPPRLSTRPQAGHARRKRHSQQSSSAKSVNGLSTAGSREASPMSQQMVFSQGSSPFALTDMASLESRLGPQGNPPNGSWFNVPWQRSSIDEATSEGPSSARSPFAVVPLKQEASPKPTLRLINIPPKSRVETQMQVKMTLYPVPEGIKKIHLPRYTIGKPKFLAKAAKLSPDTLELSTQLVCTSAMAKPQAREKALARAAASAHPSKDSSDAGEEKTGDGGEVRICNGCITREQKRANRKKTKKPAEDEEWKHFEAQRVVVFNTHEIKDLTDANDPDAPGTMIIDTPMRIACYCRHHHEKTGFQVIFTLKNHLGRLVTQLLSPSIMITDDHKTPHSNPHPSGRIESANAPALANSNSSGINDMNAIQPGHPFRQSQSTSDIQALKRSASDLVPTAVGPAASSIGTSAVPTPRNLSRPPSPSAAGPSAKKRKSSGSKIPTTLHMTPIETAAFAPPPPSNLQNGQVGPPPASVSPFSSSPYSAPTSNPFFDASSPPFGQVTQPAGTLFPAQPRTPNGNEQAVLQPGSSRPVQMDNNVNVMQPMFSAPASAQNSRAPSPNSLINGTLHQQQPNQLGQAPQLLTSGLTMTAPFTSTGAVPAVLKVIPMEGPITGNIDVSILGSGFRQGQDIYFGDKKAITTTYWADSSITCILPPAEHPGYVNVSVRGPNGQMQSLLTRQSSFVYKDDRQEALVHLALGVISQKLTGSTGDVQGLVQQIVNGANSINGGAFNGAGDGGYNGGPQGYGVNLEPQLLKVLDLLDLDDSMNKTKFNLKRKATGHTMLHLSIALGFHRFTAGLLARGANPNVQDRLGFSPLHYAALYDHPELVRRLIQHKADPTLKTVQGQLASDVARTRDVIRAIKRAGRRGSTLHSRASSATSLRSFWEPPRTQPAAPNEYSCSDTSTESDEVEASTSEGDLEDEDAHLQMAFRGCHNREVVSSRASLVDLPQVEEQGGMASAAVAIAAFREQIQQFQHSMMQNLSHIQMPNMAALHDYQAYLNSAQQRMSAFIPNIGSSLIPSPALPPAYEDLFPGGKRDGKGASTQQGDLDTKTASAARAAADYEADRKCATLYDQQQEMQQAERNTQTAAGRQVEEKQIQRQLPKLLQIGRKNNITKEQQDNLRQARAEKQKSLSRDPKLFLFWIPLLFLICFRVFYSYFPGPFDAAWTSVASSWKQPAQGTVLGEVN
ncbi:hypothetical protein M406DRAFT_329877 [Cryphonectria parasitica EP155]|uniref:IPT/TIG domain-containing protein n=1 Tax=Cryphonectria parasitica (strain ATCC 38755 / EP155) TaxID=660469 RepID=A0A9P4Y3V6_CRYP1|nr:uncharacterized protein M406DRAFT_329877 [Cryphonectria parasitica EP155]KAF3766034.1 hypothetical protein M406DRAFT_329877 [Cryphonectria parasitica EP155]